MLLFAALSTAVLVVAAVLAAGESLLPLAPPAAELRGLGRLLLGLAGWLLGLFALASTGLLGRPALAALGIALALPGALRRWRGRRRDDVPSPRAAGEPLAVRLVVAVAAVALLAPLALLAATPALGWDDAVYHLALPRLYLEAGGLRPVPFNVYALWPQGMELLYALALGIGPHPAAKLLHFGFLLATLAALRLELRDRGLLGGATAAALVVANPVVVFLARVAYVDLAVAFFLFAGALFLRRAAEAPAAHLRLAGVAAGLAAASKVTAVVFAPLLLALLWPRLRGRSGREVAGELARVALPAFLLAAPWWARTFALTGNPFYPFAYARFGGPWWSERLSAELMAWQRSIGMGRSAVDFLLLPFRVLIAGGEGYARFDGRLSPAWLLLVPLAVVFGGRLPRVRWALASAGLVFVLWAATTQQMRFLVPVLPFLALAVGDAVGAAVEPLAPPLRRRILAAAFAGAATLAVAASPGVLAAGWRTLPVLLRGEPRALLASAVPEVWRYVERVLPGDAKLLLLNTNRVFDCRREAIADSFFEASQIGDWLGAAGDPEAVAALLRREGVTHLLVERRPGPPYPPALRALLADPALARPVYESGDGLFAVFALAGGRR